ncbi:MAG: hypothetical protein RUMPE_00077 [Eubacteriales bacterium SKADARSKE-1]|nr:hypothetical protein [Eubacteriales bacterium SKADARSKE-1]
MSEKSKKMNDSLNFIKKSSSSVMEINDDIAGSVVGGMAEEYAAKELITLAEKLKKNQFHIGD